MIPTYHGFQMIVDKFAIKQGLAIVRPEDVDDLWCLRRIIVRGDLVSGKTSRILRARGPYSRPDRGERVKLTVVMKVELVKLDRTLERLRISGVIEAVSDEEFPKGSFHSLVVTPNYTLTLRKERWNEVEIHLLKSSQKRDSRFIITAIDRTEAGVGIVKGTHLQIYPSIRSGLTGKRYIGGLSTYDKYYEKIIETLDTIFHAPCRIFVTGPGPLKNTFANILRTQRKDWASGISVIEGIDVTGDDGVLVSLRSPELRKVIEDSKLAHVSELLEEAIRRISIGDRRVVYSFHPTKDAGKLGAVADALISDKVFESGIDDEDLAEFCNAVESFGGKTILIDSSTDLGMQVSALGGAVALLRFPVS